MKAIKGFDESMEILAPHYDLIIDAMKGGFDDFTKIVQSSAEMLGYVNFNNRTKANLVHDLIAQRIVNQFNEKEGVNVGVFNKIFGVNIDQKLFLRFKKMDRYFNVSNFRTPQHKKYMHQHPIDGIPFEPTYLFAGYIPDASWMGVNGFYIACWNGKVLQWIDEAGKRHSEQLTIKIDFDKPVAHTQIEKRIKLSSKVIKLNNRISGGTQS